MLRDDWFMRQLHEAADAIARAFDNQIAGRFDDALEVLDEGWNGLLANDRTIFEMVDDATAATLLGDARRVRAAARLAQAEGEVLAARGEPGAAAGRWRRALALFTAAHAAHPVPEDAEYLATVRERLGEES